MQKDRYNVGERITSRSICVLPVTITRATLLFISFKFNLRINAVIAYFPVFLIKLYQTLGLNPRVRPKGKAAASPPCGVMDRNSTGETPSALCPPQEAGFTLNLPERGYPKRLHLNPLFPLRVRRSGQRGVVFGSVFRREGRN